MFFTEIFWDPRFSWSITGICRFTPFVLLEAITFSFDSLNERMRIVRDKDDDNLNDEPLCNQYTRLRTNEFILYDSLNSVTNTLVFTVDWKIIYKSKRHHPLFANGIAYHRLYALLSYASTHDLTICKTSLQIASPVSPLAIPPLIVDTSTSFFNALNNPSLPKTQYWRSKSQLSLRFLPSVSSIHRTAGVGTTISSLECKRGLSLFSYSPFTPTTCYNTTPYTKYRQMHAIHPRFH